MASNGWLDIESCPTAEAPEEIWPVLVWHVFQGAIVSDTKNARENRFNVYWQEIPDGWISLSERLPTQEDADPLNCVIIRDKWNEIHMRGWHLPGNRSEYVAWMTPPKPPENARAMRDEAK